MKVFNQNTKTHLFKLMSWMLSGQVVALCGVPFLTRLYSPEAIGVFAAYSALLLILASAVSLKLDQGIILENSKLKRSLFSIAIIMLATVLSIVFVFVVVILKTSFQYFEKIPSIFLIFMPLHLILVTVTIVFNHDLVKTARFKDVGFLKFLTPSLLATTQILLFKFNELGLLFGSLLSSGIVAWVAIKKTFNKSLKKKSYRLVCTRFSRELFSKHRRFVYFQFPASLLESISANILILLLAGYASMVEVAFVALVIRLVRLPINLISTSVGEILRQRFSSLIVNKADCRPLFIYSFIRLSLVSIFLFCFLCFVSSEALPIVLGEQWFGIEKYLYIMSPMFALSLICTPLSRILLLNGRQHLDFYLQLTLTISLTFFLLFATLSDWAVVDILIFYSLIFSIKYMIEIWVSYISINKEA